MAALAPVPLNCAPVRFDSADHESRPAAEEIDAGEIIREDATTGKWVLAAGDTSGNAGVTRFVAGRSVAAGEALTGFRRCLYEFGDVFSAANVGAPIYLANTPGKISLVAGDSTTTTIVGYVASAFASSTVDKIARIL